MAERDAEQLKGKNNTSQAPGSTTIAKSVAPRRPVISSSAHGKRKWPYPPNTASKRIPFLSSNRLRDFERSKREEMHKGDDAAMDFVMGILASASGASKRIGHQ